MVRDGFGLLGPQRIDRSESVDRGITEQYRRALPFNIAEVGPVLSVTNQRGKLGIEMPRDLGRIDEILILEGPQDRKSTRLNSVTNAHLVCRLLLEKKKTKP